MKYIKIAEDINDFHMKKQQMAKLAYKSQNISYNILQI